MKEDEQDPMEDSTVPHLDDAAEASADAGPQETQKGSNPWTAEPRKPKAQRLSVPALPQLREGDAIGRMQSLLAYQASLQAEGAERQAELMHSMTSMYEEQARARAERDRVHHEQLDQYAKRQSELLDASVKRFSALEAAVVEQTQQQVQRARELGTLAEAVVARGMGLTDSLLEHLEVLTRQGTQPQPPRVSGAEVAGQVVTSLVEAVKDVAKATLSGNPKLRDTLKAKIERYATLKPAPAAPDTAEGVPQPDEPLKARTAPPAPPAAPAEAKAASPPESAARSVAAFDLVVSDIPDEELAAYCVETFGVADPSLLRVGDLVVLAQNRAKKGPEPAPPDAPAKAEVLGP